MRRYWTKYTSHRHPREEWHFDQLDKRCRFGWKTFGRVKLFRGRWYGFVYPSGPSAKKKPVITVYKGGRSLREALTRVEEYFTCPPK